MKLGLQVEPGETIDDVCRAAQKWADRCEWPIEFEFNGVRCVAEPGGDAGELALLQMEAQHTRLVVRSNALNVEMENGR